MTTNDLLKRVNDRNKVIILVDKNGGWCNLDFVEEDLSTIKIKENSNILFEELEKGSDNE